MPECILCGVEYERGTGGHIEIPCLRCQAGTPCPVCSEPIGLYCFLTDAAQKRYTVTIGHTGSNAAPPCELLSEPGSRWLPSVSVYEPIGHLTGPVGKKHQRIEFLERDQVESWEEEGGPCRSLMHWGAETTTPCGRGVTAPAARAAGHAPDTTG